MPSAVVTVVVPSFQQGRFLEHALESIAAQSVPVEIVVEDGGSSDESSDILKRWAPRLFSARSGPDGGQSAAINQGMRYGSAPFVAWLNADDFYLTGGLAKLVDALERAPHAALAYGDCAIVDEAGNTLRRYPTRPFRRWVFANYCLISQPATLMRRSAWHAVGGVDESLDMCMDYDLWWRLVVHGGDPVYVPECVAASREHGQTKTTTRRHDHYREARAVVRRHWGRVPLKWYLFWPYKVWWLNRRHQAQRRDCLPG